MSTPYNCPHCARLFDGCRGLTQHLDRHPVCSVKEERAVMGKDLSGYATAQESLHVTTVHEQPKRPKKRDNANEFGPMFPVKPAKFKKYVPLSQRNDAKTDENYVTCREYGDIDDDSLLGH